MKPLRIFLARVGFQSLSQLDVSPPIGLLCLAAYARERFDVEIQIVDQRAEGISNRALPLTSASHGLEKAALSMYVGAWGTRSLACAAAFTWGQP